MISKRLLLSIPAGLIVFVAGYALGNRQSPVHADSTRVYELRTYHCAPGKLGDLLTRFREHTMAIFETHGMHNVAYFIPDEEPAKSNTLVYLISHESRTQADSNWKAFTADPVWQKARSASEANGKIVEKVDREFLNPVDFSPMK